MLENVITLYNPKSVNFHFLTLPHCLHDGLLFSYPSSLLEMKVVLEERTDVWDLM